MDGPADIGERFERIESEYRPALTRLAAAYTAGIADRDDLLQEILLALWRALSRFRGDCSERTFVFRVAHNRGITFASRRRRHMPLDAAETIPDARPGADVEVDEQARHARLIAAIRQLPEPHAQAVMLVLEGLSHREIAEIQGTTENNVAARLSRARTTLRRSLGHDGDRE